MTRLEKARQRLVQLFKRRPIAELGDIKKALGIRSRTRVFQLMTAMGYFSSCSHGGRFYTLASIPTFDKDGLWSHGGVLFSKSNTLRATITELVERSPAGLTHAELREKLRLKIQDTLLQLTKFKKIGRIQLGGAYVYVSVDKPTARAQQDRRQKLLEPKLALVSTPSSNLVIAVLLAVIHNAKAAADSLFIAKQLRQRGISATAAEVEEILDRHGVKKTAPPRSRRSRR